MGDHPGSEEPCPPGTDRQSLSVGPSVVSKPEARFRGFDQRVEESLLSSLYHAKSIADRQQWEKTRV